jgi:ABC-type transport system substrate-binding protein
MNLKTEKKNVAIIVLSVALVASCAGNIILASRITPAPTYNTLIRGTGAGPHTIDPVNCWDSASSDVILQVCEGLFGYDLSDPDLPRISRLATSYWWQDTTHLQVTLRQGVMFHDGAVWNSTSAKWNFDRIMYLTNASGTLPVTSPLAEPASLYFFNMTFNDDGIMNGGTPILKNVTTAGTWNLTIVLNAPFAPFLDLLCFEASLMVSPKSTPADRFLNLDEKLVGTGPFTFDSYTPNVAVRFSRWEHCWRPVAGFQKMVFSIIQDPVTLNNAMLEGQLDLISGIIPSLLDQYEANPDILVRHVTDDTGIPRLSYYYLVFNNHLINQTLREAMSYAINYSYIIENMQGNRVVRANSPISPGYGKGFNSSVKAADFNLAHARQVLIDAGVVPDTLPVTNNTEAAWEAMSIGAFNYSYFPDNAFRSDLLVPLMNWLNEIGIRVLINPFEPPLVYWEINWNTVGIYWAGWGPDYLDPFNMLDPLFNPLSASNVAYVNDTWLNSQIALALKTTNDDSRNVIYKNIQWYLANSLYPHAFGYYPKIVGVQAADLHGVSFNAFGKFEAYGIWRA